MDLSSIGLVLDIIGVILMWKFPAPPFDLLPNGGELIYDAPNPERAKRAKRFARFHYSGLSLLLIGFMLQLASNIISDKSVQAEYDDNGKEYVFSDSSSTAFQYNTSTNHNKFSNQKLEPTVKTPIDAVNVQGTAAQL